MQPYEKPGELEPLPAGTASLYRAPWRSNFRTVSAHRALQNIGVYYKRIPGNWTLKAHVNVMKQMAAAGVRRIRLAPHLAIFITSTWTGPTAAELEELRLQLQACKASGLRPCVTFVHIPPIGTPGTRELQQWWRQGELMPVGEVGSAEFCAYQNKTYEALLFIVKQIRAAGFTEANSYDLEIGQNLWWGAPSVPQPLPSTSLSALEPGGRIYEFDRGLIRKLRSDGYLEPAIWWGQSHHLFELMADGEIPPEAVGRTVSFYSAWSGRTTDWTETGVFAKPEQGRFGVNDIWPVREPLEWLEGNPPAMVLARPESWAADRSRRDNLIELIKASERPVAITSLGTVPGEIAEAAAGGLDGWTIKARALTRSLAFWLNQGAEFVVLHSAYEPDAADGGANAYSLIPNIANGGPFEYQRPIPLLALKSFTDAFAAAEPLEELVNLTFEYALADDPELIPGSSHATGLRASDLLAVLPFQVARKRYAVALYVVTPNIARPMAALPITLQVGARLTSTGAVALRPADQTAATIRYIERIGARTALTFDIHDAVTWLVFDVE
jgi:hypothetical protein